MISLFPGTSRLAQARGLKESRLAQARGLKESRLAQARGLKESRLAQARGLKETIKPDSNSRNRKKFPVSGHEQHTDHGKEVKNV